MTEDQQVYRCWYDNPAGERCYVDVPRHRGIESVRKGIWVDKDWEFGLGDKCLHWIPPGRIVVVTKLDYPADEPRTRKRLKAVA